MSDHHQRHRDKTGEISRKHGNTIVRTLRRAYGHDFAQGFKDDDKLRDVLEKLDEPSLSRLLRDEESGHLPKKLIAGQ
jgi:hypothetical protein